LRPIQCQSVFYKPFAEIGTVNRACRDRPSVAIKIYRQTVHHSTRDERIQLVSRSCATTVLLAVLAPAKLSAFAMNVSQIYDGDDEPVEMKIDLDKETATEAALLPGYAALFPYKLIVSVDLA
jgi:hypothetical protein